MSTNTRPWLREIDHTGDIGIHVDAATVPQLFERAAIGMFDVLTDLGMVESVDETTVTVAGRDYDALMVRWLSDLNYHHTVDHHLFCDFQVDELQESKGEWGLTATVQGEAIDPNRHTVYTEIKAITFHGLEVHETENGWAVQVIFDM